MWSKTASLGCVCAIILNAAAQRNKSNLAARRGQPDTSFQRAEKDVERIKMLTELYSSATGKSAEDVKAKAFATGFHRHICCDKIRIEGDKLIATDTSDHGTDDHIELDRDEQRLLIHVLCAEDQEPLPGLYGRMRSLTYILKVLSTAVRILVNPFSDAIEVFQFRVNLDRALECADTSVLDSVENPDGVEGVTIGSLRTILDIYADIDCLYEYLPDHKYSADDQDGTLNVYQMNLSDESHSLCLILNLARLCDISELNLRRCALAKPISAEIQGLLSRCGITRLVPPLSVRACQNLFLSASSDKYAASRVWPELSEISWFSTKRDRCCDSELSSILNTPKMLFCKNITRPAVRPEDLSGLESLHILHDISEEMACYLNGAVNIRVMTMEYCSDAFPLDFLKCMDKLETFRLSNSNLTELPVEITTCLPRLSILIVTNSRLNRLPEEIGQLEELRELDISGCAFAAIPDSICNCSKLTKLNLSCNQLTSLPERLNELRQLKHLDISFNKNPDLITAVSGCISLEVLTAPSNSIEDLPADIGNLKNLRILNLRNNKLTGLRSTVSELPYLTELNVSVNSLSTLPQAIEKLRYLRNLNLNSNKFQRVPRFVGDMRERNTLFQISLSYNPLDCADSSGELGLISLWNTFGNCLMPEREYQILYLQYERDVGPHRTVQEDKSLRWKMERLGALKLPVPPSHTLSGGNLSSRWIAILRDSASAGGEPLVERAKLSRCIEVLYNPKSALARVHSISESKKSIAKDYLEAVTLCIQDKLQQGDVESATIILTQLNALLSNCPGVQMGGIVEIYTMNCLGRDPDDFESFVEMFIARIKDSRFTASLASPGQKLKVRVLLYWKRQLGDTLGLISVSERPRNRRDPAQFEDEQANVLRNFFDEFSPKSVIKALTEEMNTRNRTVAAWLYLERTGKGPSDDDEIFFRAKKREEGLSDGRSHSYVIREAGTEEILVRMGILERVPVNKLHNPSKRQFGGISHSF